MDLLTYFSVYIVIYLQLISYVHNSNNFSDTDDFYLNSFQLLTKYGYHPEKHLVKTEDGYILSLFRIPRPGPPVLLTHGITDSSDSWIILGPTNSLGYILADVGFDIWLFNARGNKYSKRNSRNYTEKQYWDYSWEQVGTQDLPATIDYILQTSLHPQVNYIGYSQGTTIFFVMGSLKPEYNVKVKHAVMLAPVAWINNLVYPLLDMLVENLESLHKFFKSLRFYEISTSNRMRKFISALVCQEGVPQKIICDLNYYLTVGLKNTSHLFPKKLSIISQHIPAGASVKSLVHYIQCYRSKRFQRFNYTTRINKRLYASPEPPMYPVSLVTTPLTLIVSESDWFSNVGDVQILRDKVPNVVNYIQYNKSLDLSHIEFLYGSRVKSLINDPVVKILMEVNNK